MKKLIHLYIGANLPSGPAMPASCRNFKALSFEEVISLIPSSNLSYLFFSSVDDITHLLFFILCLQIYGESLNFPNVFIFYCDFHKIFMEFLGHRKITKTDARPQPVLLLPKREKSLRIFDDIPTRHAMLGLVLHVNLLYVDFISSSSVVVKCSFVSSHS